MQLLTLIVKPGSEIGHAVPVAADRARARIAARNHLTEDRQIRVHTEEALRAVHADPEARDDLVEDEQGAPFPE